jgi:hypothetical protein
VKWSGVERKPSEAAGGSGISGVGRDEYFLTGKRNPRENSKDLFFGFYLLLFSKPFVSPKRKPIRNGRCLGA